MDKKYIDKITFDTSVELRGLVLDLTIDIERRIDDCLSEYFCKNEKVAIDLHECLWATERITLGSKKDILFILLKRHKPEYLKLNPTFLGLLDNLIPHRNIFAHLEIDYDRSGPTNDKYAIVFKKYKNGKIDPKTYTVTEIHQITHDLKEIAKRLSEITPIKPPQTSSATD